MARFKLLCLGIMLAGFTQLATAQKVEFSEFDLDNGLHVILYPDNSSPSVTVGVHYNVGSKNENPDLTGFAHFFEHLMFEGTENIPRGKYGEMIKNAGGTLNAYTMVDKTYYYETLPSNQLELALWMESERMLHATVDSTGIATQKQVVAEEKKQRYDSTPYGDSMKELMERAFTVHPYRWQTIGDVERLVKADDSNFVDFYKTYYVPNNACLIVAGDIEETKAKAMVEKYFADIPKGTRHMHRPTEVEPPLAHEVRDTVYGDVQLPMLMYGYRVPGAGDNDSYALTYLYQILSGGQSSRMNKELVDKQQIALFAAVGSMSYQDPSLAVVRSIPANGVTMPELEKAIEEQIEEVKENGITEREYEKVQNRLETSMISGRRKASTIADNLGDYYTYYNNTNYINEVDEKYMSVTIDDIKRVANKYFNKDNRVTLYYLPNSAKEEN